MKIEKQILQKVDKYTKKSLGIELKQQGHYLTGGLESSIQGEINELPNGAVLEGSIADYGLIINTGATPSKIPYQENSGAKSSKYINGLINYFKLRGLSEKEAKQAAFATAKVQKREGMPTANSYQYAKNNERKLFIEKTAISISPIINDIVSKEIDTAVEKIFNKQQSEII